MLYFISIASFSAVFFLIIALFFYFGPRTAKNTINKRLTSISGDMQNIDHDIEVKFRLSDISFLDKILKLFQITKFLNRLIEQGGLKWTVGRLILLVLFLAYLGYYAANLLKFPFILSVVVGIGAGSLPFGYIFKKRQARIKKFEEQFPDCLSLLANVLRAGMGLTMGMKLLSEEMSEPSSGEFQKVVVEMELGLDLKLALEHLIQRVCVAEVSLFVSSVLLQREIGGNLAEFLDKLELTIRERFKLKRELVTLSAESKFSGLVIALIPIIIGGILFVLNPRYMGILFYDPLGKKFLLAAFVLQFLGFLVMKRLTLVKF